MAYRIFFVFLILAHNVFAGDAKETDRYVDELVSLNDKLSYVVSDEPATNEIIQEKDKVIKEMMLYIKQQHDFKDTHKYKDDLNIASSKLIVDQDRKNEAGILKGKIIIDTLQVKIRIDMLINELIESSKIDDFSQKLTGYIASEEEWLKKQNSYDNPEINENEKKSKTYLEISDANRHLVVEKAVFRDLLMYSKNNLMPAKKAISDGIGIQWLINNINQIGVIGSVNDFISKLKIDVGSVAAFLCILCLFKLLLPFTNRSIDFIFDKFTSTNDVPLNNSLSSIKKPLHYLAFFVVFDIAVNALFYRYKNEQLLIKAEFIFYVIISAWLLFKLIDCLFIFQINKIQQSNNELRKEVLHLAFQCMKGVVALLSFAIVLNYFGVDITAILSTLGIGGLAFALAAKDSLSNLFGGINILLDNLFSLGDWVVIDKVEGNVIEIGLRSTTIRTFENARISIPNAMIANVHVTNWSKRAVGRRIKMNVGISYDSDMNCVKMALDDIRKMLENHVDIATKNDVSVEFNEHRLNYRVSSAEDLLGVKTTLFVNLDNFNSNSIDILIYCFSKSTDMGAWLKTKEEIIFSVANIFENYSIKFAPRHEPAIAK